MKLINEISRHIELFFSPFVTSCQVHSVATIHRPQRPASNGAHAFEDTKAARVKRAGVATCCHQMHMLSQKMVPGAIMCHDIL